MNSCGTSHGTCGLCRPQPMKNCENLARVLGAVYKRATRFSTFPVFVPSVSW
jgi:hypothetical protein